MGLNGWSEDEIERLVTRTGRSRACVEAFCRAVDQRLFLQLDERKRRATLYFHIGGPDAEPDAHDGPARAR